MTLAPVPTMDPVARDLWIAALRSTDYPQAKGALQNADGYCCLGVLCEVAIKAGVPVEKTEPDPNGVVFYDGDCEHLPASVCDWAKITSNPTANITEPDNESAEDEENEREFVMLNDDYDWSFSDIADVIEAQL